MKRMISSLTLALLLAGCGPKAATTTPHPSTDWSKILRAMALATLRAMVCTDPTTPGAAELPPVAPAPADAPSP